MKKLFEFSWDERFDWIHYVIIHYVSKIGAKNKIKEPPGGNLMQ